MSLSAINYDRKYIRSVCGQLKICCLLCHLAALLTIWCSSVSVSNARGVCYSITALLGILFTGGLLLIHLFALLENSKINYSMNVARNEAYLGFGLAACTFFAAAFALTLNILSYTIVAFFGFVAFCCYIWDGYLIYCRSLKCDASTQTLA